MSNVQSKRRGKIKHAASSGKKVQIIPLGGIGEIGKNMYVIRYADEMIIIDAGLSFPTDEMFGIDVVIPDITYLLENQDKIQAVLLTHGHEDHIGALPYFLKKINVPVYGTKLTLGLVEVKLREHRMLGDCTLHTIRPEDKLELGSFKIEFFRTNHSIPDSVGIAVKTPVGTIVHTGDFKFDQTPVSGQITDYYRLARLGERGVLAVLSDSTNAERPGYTYSEKVVGDALMDIFRTARQRIIIATFASNVDRIQQVIDAAAHYKRKVAVVGRSMVNVVSIAQELGYLHAEAGTIIEVDAINKLPPHKVVILTTGSQGEPMAALTRIAKDEHKKVELVSGDTVIISASPIPGNEKLVSRTIDNLFARGANVIYERVSGIHVSGHASQEELKLMLNLLKPKYLIPIHGEHRHLIHHKQVAEQVGIPADNVFILENGQILEFTSRSGRVVGTVPAGHVLVDGLGIGDVGSIVLRDRKLLSEDGIIMVAMSVKRENGEVLAGPDIYTRGFVYVRESETLLDEAREHVLESLTHVLQGRNTDWSYVKGQMKDSLSRFIWDKMHRRPIILPVVMEI
ncbi:MAG: ribonuclease J [Firmicutes bacterium]|nr:ribonuclease J [Bacillota bacterium]